MVQVIMSSPILTQDSGFGIWLVMKGLGPYLSPARNYS